MEDKTFAMTLTKSSKKAVLDAVEKGMALAELEPLGLSTRTLAVIEEQLGIIYIEDLLKMTWADLKGTPNLGAGAVKEVEESLRNINLLTDCVKRKYARSIIPNINRAKMIRKFKAPKPRVIKHDLFGQVIE